MVEAYGLHYFSTVKQVITLMPLSLRILTVRSPLFHYCPVGDFWVICDKKKRCVFVDTPLFSHSLRLTNNLSHYVVTYTVAFDDQHCILDALNCRTGNLRRLNSSFFTNL